MPPVALFLVTLGWIGAGSAIPVNRCHQSEYICEGRCPLLPSGTELPPEDEDPGGGGGLCLKDTETDACVCWLRNSELHLQTLFKCEAIANSTVRHVMCLPPPICFPPGPSPGCLIVLRCPCTDLGRGAQLGRWRSGVALILRSKTPVPALAPSSEAIPEQPEADSREFSVKHLLFLLAFVIAPLLCWCMLTFFHEGKCRRKRRIPESEPMAAEPAVEEVEQAPGPCVLPTAPKMESPPPYREAAEPGERCLLAAECGPPPSYEDAVRNQRYRIQDADSE